MDDFVDYEEYARSFPQDESLVSIPEGGTYKSIRSLDQIWTRPPSPICYRLSAKPPPQPNSAQKSSASIPAIGKSTDTAHINVQSAGPVNSHPIQNLNAQNPTTSTQIPISPPPSTSLSLDRNHPNAATIPGLTPGRNRCDTCFNYHHRCDHGPNGEIDPVLAARPHNRRGAEN